MQTADPSGPPVTGPLSTNTNDPTSPTINQLTQLMSTLLNLLAAYVAAGSFGVAFVMTALEQPLQQHSGTQSYVRVIR